MSEQAVKKNSRIALIILLLVFLLPVLTSWYLVFFTDYAREGNGAQHGELITPPRQLEDIQLLRAGKGEPGSASLHGKWSMLFFAEGNCESRCKEDLLRSRQIRLATGKEMLRIQRIAVIDESHKAEFSDYVNELFSGQLYVSKDDLDEEFLQQFKDQLGDQKNNDETAIFLIDPRGFLMMRYSSKTDPSGIIRDLSRLLRIST